MTNNNNNNNKSDVTLDNKKNKGKKLLSIKFENKTRIWSKVSNELWNTLWILINWRILVVVYDAYGIWNCAYSANS